jgi:hypothetical protein
MMSLNERPANSPHNLGYRRPCSMVMSVMPHKAGFVSETITKEMERLICLVVVPLSCAFDIVTQLKKGTQ